MRALFLIILLSCAQTANAIWNIKHLDESKKEAASPAQVQDPKDLSKHFLFDSPYELAANYSPVIALRALAESNIYKDKRKAYIDRHYYANAKAIKPYATLHVDITVKGKGMFGRHVDATGLLSFGSKKLSLDYDNEMKFRLPRKAHMEIQASLGEYDLLSLAVESDGKKMTNSVIGSFFAKPVKYLTEWRTTKGTLAGHPYEIYVKGVPSESTKEEKSKDKQLFVFDMTGKIGDHQISGHGSESSKDYYEIEEFYGPLMIKTTVKVFD